MKFFLVLSVVLIAIWLWRSNREAKPGLKPKNPPAGHAPLEMLGCSVCDVHVVAADAIRGKNGIYCCQEHRQRAEH
jgi:uncharacterized protein